MDYRYEPEMLARIDSILYNTNDMPNISRPFWRGVPGKYIDEELWEKYPFPTMESRIKMSCTRQGINRENWDGFATAKPYCDLFNEQLKSKVRSTWGKCVLCETHQSENLTLRRGKQIIAKLSVHHVFIEKKACCETEIEEMEIVRLRFPDGVARFGEPKFSEEEIMYIRMMVPLCVKCHSKMLGEPMNMPYEKTKYRKFFTEQLLEKLGGKSYGRHIT